MKKISLYIQNGLDIYDASNGGIKGRILLFNNPTYRPVLYVLQHRPFYSQL
ncbi:hypothetical protein [Macellibacteroides fermentans]|uniref:hypothetical protein n=1 Tax=Macellibacteroides fermentans TaxID=879969 RepID=UPI00406D183F